MPCKARNAGFRFPRRLYVLFSDTFMKWQDLPELFEAIGYQRHTEIEGWLRQFGKPWEKWVALDDKPWLFKPFLSTLVLCDTAIGLDDSVLTNLANKIECALNALLPPEAVHVSQISSALHRAKGIFDESLAFNG